MTVFTRTAPRAIAWMCAAHVASMTGFSTYVTLLPRLQIEWALSNSAAGFISGALFAGYMSAVPLLASLTDRVDARRVYFVSSAAAALASIGFALFAQGLATAGLFQFIIGAGIAGTYMPGLRALTDNVSGASAQSRAVAFYTAAFGFGTTLSIIVSGTVADALGWRWAFGLSTVGPLVAGMMVVSGLPRRPPQHRHETHVLDFRPVLRQRDLRAYILGYAVHCWELFGSRSWLVAFFVFAQTLAVSASAWSPVTIAALANFIGPASSVLGNELAMRAGRERVIWRVMLVSGLLTCALGFAAPLLPWYVLTLLAMLHLVFIMGDSSALTAGVVERADAKIRGATMAIYSMLGFGAGFAAPLVFGIVLDLAGGNASAAAWGFAYASLGVGAIFTAFLIRRNTPAATQRKP
jgi:MFS family permease